MSEAGAQGSRDHRYMALALDLARRGLGRSWPNPAVGCVIVQGERIVGRGWTQPGGRPHGEQVALAQAGRAAEGATAFVTLEPCNHHGETPPCSTALLTAGLARVVVATLDPDPRTNGGGVASLRSGGVRVDVGQRAEEARQLNAGFLSRIEHGRPWVTGKIAASLDGRIAYPPGSPAGAWITSPAARTHAHGERARHDAILIGRGTAIADDPMLTCRLPGLADASPLRVVLDSQARLAPESRLMATAGQVPLLVLVAPTAPAAATRALVAGGAMVETVEAEGEGAQHRVALPAVLRALARRGVTRLLVEGGPGVLTGFAAAGLIDRWLIYHAPRLMGAEAMAALGALPLDQGALGEQFTLTEERVLGPDRLVVLERAAGDGPAADSPDAS